MPILYIMCGVPGVGKSTYVKNHCSDDFEKWVSRDAIRFSLVKETEPYFSKETLVYNIFIQEIIKGLEDDCNVYADATHLTKASRSKLLRRIPKGLYDEVHLIWLKADISVCLYQNELRKGTRAYVDPKAIKRMHYGIEEPSLDEGIDEIEIIKVVPAR